MKDIFVSRWYTWFICFFKNDWHSRMANWDEFFFLKYYEITLSICHSEVNWWLIRSSTKSLYTCQTSFGQIKRTYSNSKPGLTQDLFKQAHKKTLLGGKNGLHVTTWFVLYNEVYSIIGLACTMKESEINYYAIYIYQCTKCREGLQWQWSDGVLL